MGSGACIIAIVAAASRSRASSTCQVALAASYADAVAAVRRPTHARDKAACGAASVAATIGQAAA